MSIDAALETIGGAVLTVSLTVGIYILILWVKHSISTCCAEHKNKKKLK